MAISRVSGRCLYLIALASISLQAQEVRQPAFVYEAYFRIEYADLEAWNQRYWDYSVPVLEGLREEGIIEGWDQYHHHTGGEYNIRFAVRTYDWNSISEFWAQYLERVEAAMPAGEWTATERMLVEHDDEIWEIGELNTRPDFELTHLYSSMFRVSFADMEVWNDLWSDVSGEILAEAMDDGLLGGWVRLDHNTGGPYNSKHLFLFDDWDSIDDVIFERMIGGLMEAQPDVWTRLNRLFHDHTDVIWERTTNEE